MAIKDFPDWTSFYSGSPIVNPEVLRELTHRAKVHNYLQENDLSFINESFIAIHTLEAGVRTIELPEEQHLYEVFRDQELMRMKTHYIELKGKKTYLFFRGSKKVWLGL